MFEVKTLRISTVFSECKTVNISGRYIMFTLCSLWSKKSPTGFPERTPQPEYLIALATYLGVHWKGPIQFFMDLVGVASYGSPSYDSARRQSELIFS